MKKIALVVVVAVLAASLAIAQQNVNERRAADPAGVVEIENVAGSVRVIGWERAEVEVTGTLGRGTERLEFSGGPGRTLVKVVLPKNAKDVDGSDLTVKVPAGSRLEVETVSADITAEQVAGVLDLETVSGTVRAVGKPSEVKVQSVSGDVEVPAVDGPVRAQTVSGRVTLLGARGSVEVSSVSGPIKVVGADVESGELHTVSGTITFEGELAGAGRLEVETVSGEVELSLPASVAAEFRVTSFSGNITNELGPAARRTSEYGPGWELEFSNGGGGARVEVQSMSGPVTLRKK
jgi:DUF4097 and DUF4098 domain-containing protein YvlB